MPLSSLLLDSNHGIVDDAANSKPFFVNASCHRQLLNYGEYNEGKFAYADYVLRIIVNQMIENPIMYLLAEKFKEGLKHAITPIAMSSNQIRGADVFKDDFRGADVFKDDFRPIILQAICEQFPEVETRDRCNALFYPGRSKTAITLQSLGDKGTNVPFPGFAVPQNTADVQQQRR